MNTGTIDANAKTGLLWKSNCVAETIGIIKPGIKKSSIFIALKVKLFPLSVMSGIIWASATDKAAMTVTIPVIISVAAATNTIAAENRSFRPPEISMLE